MPQFSRAKVVLLLLAALLLPVPSVPAETKAECPSAHDDTASALESDSANVKRFSIGACLVCHKPADNKFPAPNPFFTHLHRSLAAGGERPGCRTCHVWRDNGSFGLEAGGREINYGTIRRTDLPLVLRKFSSWQRSPYLDSAHGKANVGCAACHGTRVPGPGAVAESSRCMGCHGFFECLADKTAPKDFPERNPHGSHLGQPGCTLCHKGHTVSRSACLNCHPGFTMNIPPKPNSVRKRR